MKRRLRRAEYSRTYGDWIAEGCGRGVGAFLEIGSNEGAVLRAVQATGLDAIGVDIDPSVLAPAPTGLRQLVGDAENLPFSAGTFDVVAMFDVIEHLNAPFAALTEVARVLRPGGHGFFTTPNVNAADRYLHPKTWSGIADPTHRYLFSLRSLVHLVKTVGLDPIAARTPFHGVGSRLGRVLEPSGLGGQLWLHCRRP